MKRRTLLNLRINPLDEAEDVPRVEICGGEAGNLESEHKDDETDLSTLVRLVSNNKKSEEEEHPPQLFVRKKIPKFTRSEFLDYEPHFNRTIIIQRRDNLAARCN